MWKSGWFATPELQVLKDWPAVRGEIRHQLRSGQGQRLGEPLVEVGLVWSALTGHDDSYVVGLANAHLRYLPLAEHFDAEKVTLQVHILPFLDRMELAYAIADLAIAIARFFDVRRVSVSRPSMRP